MLLLIALTALTITLSAMSAVGYAGAAFNLITTDEPDASPELGIGFHAGAAANFDLGSMILEPGVRFVTRGYGQSVDYGYGQKIDYTYALNYLDIFAKLKFNVPMGSMQFLPYIGVAPALKMSESIEYNGNSYTLPWDMYESLNLFALVGADFVIAENFIIGFEFDYGFMNLLTEDYQKSIASDNDKPADTEYKASQMSILVNLGYKFDF